MMMEKMIEARCKAYETILLGQEAQLIFEDAYKILEEQVSARCVRLVATHKLIRIFPDVFEYKKSGKVRADVEFAKAYDGDAEQVFNMSLPLAILAACEKMALPNAKIELANEGWGGVEVDDEPMQASV